jgi:hypothetical protein
MIRAALTRRSPPEPKSPSRRRPRNAFFAHSGYIATVDFGTFINIENSQIRRFLFLQSAIKKDVSLQFVIRTIFDMRILIL